MPRRSNSKRLLAAQEQFKVAITTFIVSRGARPSLFYDYELETPAGLLNVSVYGNWIACRFDDVNAGRVFTQDCDRPCNPFSGKWNFHYGDGSVASLAPQHALADFGYFLDRLAEWQATPA